MQGVGWGVGGWWGYFKQVTSLGLGIKHSSKSWVSPDWPVTSHGQSGKCKWMFESHRNVECRAWRLLFVFPSACEGPDSLTFSQVANSRTMAITLEPNYMQLSDWTLPAPWECCYQLMGNKQMRASGELWAAKSPSKPGVELQWSVGDWDLSSVQISKLLTPDRPDDHQEQPGLKVGLASHSSGGQISSIGTLQPEFHWTDSTVDNIKILFNFWWFISWRTLDGYIFL